jgi:hypothetical protein
MSEKTSTMSLNIGKRVRYYIVLFTIVIVCIIWGNEIWKFITTSLETDPREFDLLQKIGATFVTVVGGAVLVFLNFGRDINLHNLIDTVFFHVRDNTNRIIQQEMIDRVKRYEMDEWEKMKDNQEEVTRLFYHFVNEQEALRSLAFTYWEQYFVNIYIIFFGTISFIVSLILVIMRWKFDWITFSPLIFLFIISVVALSTYYSLKPKLYALPVQQTAEFCSSHSDEFRQQVKARFGGVIIQ